jgi:hypothetical protein
MPVTINGTTGVVFPDGVTQGSGVPNASATSGAPLVSNGTIYTQNTAVAVAFGGTGITTTPSNGFVPIGNGTNYTAAALTGTSNQITVTNASGSITLSTPQSINTASSVQFGSFGVGTAASGTSGEIRATNNVTAYYSSDKRLKDNVQTIENALNKVSQIRGVEFDWNNLQEPEDGYFVRKHDIGVIAQEVEKVLPEVVGTREDGIKAVKYDRLVPLLIEAIKELKAEIDNLKSK